MRLYRRSCVQYKSVKMADLKVNIGNLEFKNPVLTASGTFGYGIEFEDFLDINSLGGIIVKGTTLEHREGNAYPRMAETASGMLNAVGLQNKGVDVFLNEIYPHKNPPVMFLVHVRPMDKVIPVLIRLYLANNNQ